MACKRLPALFTSHGICTLARPVMISCYILYIYIIYINICKTTYVCTCMHHAHGMVDVSTCICMCTLVGYLLLATMHYRTADLLSCLILLATMQYRTADLLNCLINQLKTGTNFVVRQYLYS